MHALWISSVDRLPCAIADSSAGPAGEASCPAAGSGKDISKRVYDSRERCGNLCRRNRRARSSFPVLRRLYQNAEPADAGSLCEAPEKESLTIPGSGFIAIVSAKHTTVVMTEK